MRVERLPPRGARIGEQDVDAVRVLADLLEQLLDAVDGGRVGGGGDGLGAGGEVGQGVEGFAGGFAGGGLAGGDEDLGGTGLEEAAGKSSPVSNLWVYTVWRKSVTRARLTLMRRSNQGRGNHPSRRRLYP